MRRLLVCLLVVAVLIPATSSAFDGMRKGFVLGGGLGVAPMAKWSVESGGESFDESKVGFGLHVVIGYAWDEFNMIVYEGNIAGYTSDEFYNTITGQSLTLAQGFNGASWYHYFGPQGKSFFTVVGGGFYIFDVEDASDAWDPGLGYLVGGGYEFARHFQIAGYLSGGQTSLLGVVDFGHTHLNVLVSAVAF